MLTLTEAAEQAGVNENTARYYRNKFGEYFPATGEGRNRRYAQETVQILRVIKDCYDQGMDAEKVKQKLNDTFGVPVVTTTTALEKPKKELAGLVGENLAGIMEAVVERAMAKALIQLKEADQQEFERIVDEALQRQAETYTEEIKRLKSEINYLNEHIIKADVERNSRDRDLMNRIREIQLVQQERVNKKPWWKFWN